jgi:hypothetical protein
MFNMPSHARARAHTATPRMADVSARTTCVSCGLANFQELTRSEFGFLFLYIFPLLNSLDPRNSGQVNAL